MKTKFMYVRDEKRFPVGCVAMKPYFGTNPTDSVPQALLVGISVYNHKDEYDKSDARAVAQTRLIMCPLVIPNHQKTTHLQELALTGLSKVDFWVDLNYDWDVPKRFRKAVALTLVRTITNSEQEKLNKDLEEFEKEMLAPMGTAVAAPVKKTTKKAAKKAAKKTKKVAKKTVAKKVTKKAA